ncbi:MAG: hypothetical protein ACOC5E_03665 [Acidobacteriota bacterium]
MRPLPCRVTGALSLAAALLVVTLPSSGAAVSALQSWTLEHGERPLPDEVPEAVGGVLQPQALTLRDGDSGVMDLWLTESLPPATGKAATGELVYPSIPVGTFMGVMRLEADHIDYRDQTVPAGVYAVRYLQQPVDGAHVGVTFFRDFLALTPLTARTTPEPVDFQAGLARALQLNPHPFVWALWPADEVYPPDESAEEPFLAEVESGKWALRTTIPRDDGDPLALALVVVGSEPPEGYF